MTDTDFLIGADSMWSVTAISPERETYTAEELQRLVGGHFELLRDPVVDTVSGKTYDVWVNEEPFLFNMPLNALASRIVGVELFGPVVFTLKGRVK
jgi:hypothetical protein